MKGSSNFEKFCLSIVQHKVMSPNMLLLLVATLLQTANIDAFASGETEPTQVPQNTTFYPTEEYNNLYSKEDDLLYPDSKKPIYKDVGNILSMEKTLAYLNTIEDPIIRRAIEIHLSHCPYNDMCNFSLGLENPNDEIPCCEKCRCDVDCKRECCPNFVMDLDELARADGNELECLYPALQPSQKSTLNCTLFCPELHSGYYFITDCPPGTDIEERKACRAWGNTYVMSEEFDFSNVTPVTDIRSKLNYRNTFCASCHGFAKENLLAWDVLFNCYNSFLSGLSLKERFKQMINTKECDITFHPPKLYTPEKCIPLISSCNQSGFWSQYDEVIERLCHSPLGSSFDLRYKNVFCMICNNISPVCLHGCAKSDERSSNSFSALLNLRSQARERLELTQCSIEMVFDPYLMKCRKLYCSPTKILNKGKCVNIFSQIYGAFFETEITFFPLERCPVTLAKEVAKTIGTWFDSLLSYWTDSKYEICKRDTVYKVNNNNTIVKDNYIAMYSQNLNSNVTFISSKWKFEVNGFYEFDRVYEMILNITNSTISFQIGKNINVTLLPRLMRVFDIANLSEGSSHITLPANILDHPSTNMSGFDTDDLSEGSSHFTFPANLLDHPSTNMSGFDTDDLSESSSHFTFPANLLNPPSTNMSDFDIADLSNRSSPITFSTVILSGSINMNDTNVVGIDFTSSTLMCLLSDKVMSLIPSLLIPCTMIELDEQLFNWSYTEYGVYVPKLNLCLNMTDFNVVNNTQKTALWICTQVYMPAQAVEKETFQSDVSFEADAILSIVCTSVSIICLLLTLIVYIVLPELQTVPGKNNMLLVINLFMAQVMYIVFVFIPNSTGFICKAVGVLLHFFWLSAIFWMNVSTFHMLNVFVKLNKPNSKTSVSKTVIVYTVIVIVSSVIFVLSNIIKALVESDMVEMGYGPDICYISSGKMVGLTFALPVGFVVASNLVMFLVVIYKFRSLPSVEMNVKHNRNNAVILAKLSSLTGITWIFGFLYVWTEEIALSYLFIVLNASIGIFIMASFILNKRIIALIRSKFSRKSTMNNGSD